MASKQLIIFFCSLACLLLTLSNHEAHAGAIDDFLEELEEHKPEPSKQGQEAMKEAMEQPENSINGR